MEGHARVARIRAFRSEEAEMQVEQRKTALALLLTQPHDIEKALRESRRAGRAGARHYDPARHAALIRLWKSVHRPDPAQRTDRAMIALRTAIKTATRSTPD